MSKEKSNLEKVENTILDKLNGKERIAYDTGDKIGQTISDLIDKAVDSLIPEKK